MAQKVHRKRITAAIVVGARPNFVKIASLFRPMRTVGITPILVHTGQHYSKKLSDNFFTQLRIPEPNYSLNVGSGTHAFQTAHILLALEPILTRIKPNVVVVVGDVNSTLAAALTAVKLHIPVAHIEAGLRSNNMAMAEEINRRLTDRISDYLFITERDAKQNLLCEGTPANKIFFVGNTMIDTLLANRVRASATHAHQFFHLPARSYVVVTLHRPELVDSPDLLVRVLKSFRVIPTDIPIVFPAHPRTQKILDHSLYRKILQGLPNLRLLEPLSYLEFLCLLDHAKFVLTDSGGIQEETTVLHVPCLTIRTDTERPVTTTLGTNVLVGFNTKRLFSEVKNIIRGTYKRGRIPPKWDGYASKRIASILSRSLRASKQ
jgi:UDP-N-acetylglucosamine 2-epimerase (non-hydrolysing)